MRPGKAGGPLGDLAGPLSVAAAIVGVLLLAAPTVLAQVPQGDQSVSFEPFLVTPAASGPAPGQAATFETDLTYELAGTTCAPGTFQTLGLEARSGSEDLAISLSLASLSTDITGAHSDAGPEGTHEANTTVEITFTVLEDAGPGVVPWRVTATAPALTIPECTPPVPEANITMGGEIGIQPPATSNTSTSNTTSDEEEAPTGVPTLAPAAATVAIALTALAARREHA